MEQEQYIAISITKNELTHLINDLIAYCNDLEEKGLNVDDTYGYYSRKKLIKKLYKLENAYFQDETSNV